MSLQLAGLLRAATCGSFLHIKPIPALTHFLEPEYICYTNQCLCAQKGGLYDNDQSLYDCEK